MFILTFVSPFFNPSACTAYRFFYLDHISILKVKKITEYLYARFRFTKWFKPGETRGAKGELLYCREKSLKLDMDLQIPFLTA